MFDKSNRKQLIGSFVNVINSGLNFGIYIFLPILIGIQSYTNFQLENVKPSFLILLFSPSLPFIIFNKKTTAFTFFSLFFTISAILFFLSDKLLLIANMCWLLYGFMAMILYYNEEKKKFYFYTILLTITQILTLFSLKDYYNSYLITSVFCFLLIILIEKKSLLNYIKDFDLAFSKNIINSLLRPIFSLSFFWQILLFTASKYGSNDFLSLTYYSKISLSTTVAIFTISSLDILKEKKVNAKNFFILSAISVIAVNVLIIALDYFGKNSIRINNIMATAFLLGSVFPSLVFNLISDSIRYRLVFIIILIIAISFILLGYNPLITTSISMLMLTFLSFATYKVFLKNSLAVD